MVQLLKYSDVLGPYLFMILVVSAFACAVWLISELKKNVLVKKQWFVKRDDDRYKQVTLH